MSFLSEPDFFKLYIRELCFWLLKEHRWDLHVNEPRPSLEYVHLFAHESNDCYIVFNCIYFFHPNQCLTLSTWPSYPTLSNPVVEQSCHDKHTFSFPQVYFRCIWWIMRDFETSVYTLKMMLLKCPINTLFFILQYFVCLLCISYYENTFMSQANPFVLFLGRSLMASDVIFNSQHFLFGTYIHVHKCSSNFILILEWLI